MSTELIIEKISETEGNESLNLCEIKFEAVVTMYKPGFVKQKSNILFMSQPSKSRPQWFKCRNNLTMEAIKYSDEYQLGRILKYMLAQIDKHIKKYGFETNNL